jgi:heme-degrading monooxygenase HmoA
MEVKNMIARIWYGTVPREKADAYYKYLSETGVQECKATPGNRGVHVFRRFKEDQAHFVFISYWDSMEAIRAFAGERIDIARYYPEDREYLLELKPLVTHYEVLTAMDTDSV